MAKRKPTKKYYFSVEGQTEQWYLKWLEDTINITDMSLYKVTLNCQVQKDPLKRVKSMNVIDKTEIWHISDYESDDSIHVKQFLETMDNMKAAGSLGKNITYKFGYSNLTFDLWIILHCDICNGGFTHRKNYIKPINRAFNEHFENLDEYKHESNFKRCLNKLDLSNVLEAVNRAKIIMQINQDNGYTLHNYKGYKYFKENPSLDVWKVVEKILTECGLVKQSIV